MTFARLTILAFILTSCALIGRGTAPRQTERILATAPVFASRCWSSWPAPPGCLFGMSGVQSIIQSAYAYEASLLDWSTPVGDYDYMLGFGRQSWVSLPGGSWRHYSYYGSVYVQGSGCVLKFGAPAPWYGRFAFLHMAATAYGCGTMAGRVSRAVSGVLKPKSGDLGPNFPAVQFPSQLSGDERTALAASAVLLPNAPAAGTLRGGHVVGLSRWPDWYSFGNGSCCAADAHLCLLLDFRAWQWFQYVAAGRDHRPAPPFRFNASRWGEWRRSHHRSWITEWSSPRCKGRSSCLTWEASVWLRHQWLGGIRDRGTWYRRAKHRRYGYMRWGFRSGCMWGWPALHAVKVSRKC